MKLEVENHSTDAYFDSNAIEQTYDLSTQELEMLSGDIEETISYVHTHISDHLSRLADTTDSIIMSNRFSRG